MGAKATLHGVGRYRDLSTPGRVLNLFESTELQELEALFGQPSLPLAYPHPPSNITMKAKPEINTLPTEGPSGPGLPVALLEKASRLDLDVAKVHRSPWNRSIFTPEGLAELTASIRQHGVAQPGVARPHPTIEGEHQIVIGERRWLASKAAGRVTMPFMVAPLTDRETVELQKVENLQREDVDPIEEGIGLRQMMTDFGYSLQELITRTGKEKSHIYGRIKLGQLCPAAVKAYRGGAFPESVALRIARLPTEKMQEAFLEEAKHYTDRDEGLTDRTAASLIAEKFMKELKGAPFDQKDNLLVPPQTEDGVNVPTNPPSARHHGGACGDCRMRSGNAPDFDPKRGRGDICLFPSCYREKCERAHSRRAEKHVAAGGAVVAEKLLDKVFSSYSGTGVSYNSPLQPGGETVYSVKPLPGNDGKVPKNPKYPTRAELAKHVGIQPVLALNPHTGLTVELYPVKELSEAAKKAGLVSSGGGGSDTYRAQQKAEQAKREREQQIRAAQVGALVEAVTSPAGEQVQMLDVLRPIVAQLALTTDDETARAIAKRRALDLEPFKKKGGERGHRPAVAALGQDPQLTGLELIALLIELLASTHCGPDPLKIFAPIYQVDLEKISKSAAAELAEQKAAKKAKLKAKPQKRPAKGGTSDSPVPAGDSPEAPARFPRGDGAAARSSRKKIGKMSDKARARLVAAMKVRYAAAKRRDASA